MFWRLWAFWHLFALLNSPWPSIPFLGCCRVRNFQGPLCSHHIPLLFCEQWSESDVASFFFSHSRNWDKSPHRFAKVAKKLYLKQSSRKDKISLQASCSHRSENTKRHSHSTSFCGVQEKKEFWLLKGVVRIVLGFDWWIKYYNCFYVARVPSHNASDVNHMHAQLCIGIWW